MGFSLGAFSNLNLACYYSCLDVGLWDSLLKGHSQVNTSPQDSHLVSSDIACVGHTAIRVGQVLAR
jgi:hypothetical protein